MYAEFIGKHIAAHSCFYISTMVIFNLRPTNRLIEVNACESNVVDRKFGPKIRASNVERAYHNIFAFSIYPYTIPLTMSYICNSNCMKLLYFSWLITNMHILMCKPIQHFICLLQATIQI